MDTVVNDFVQHLKKIEHGFKLIIEAGENILQHKEISHFDVSLELLDDESYQSRMLATYLLGALSTMLPEALQMLETVVARDSNWRVQEMLAKAFDSYCNKMGYEASLPKINAWLSDHNPNVRRAVIEGLRIWTGRPFFKQNPKIAIKLISQHRADESEYLRKSVGNALRDIQKKFPELVRAEISCWDLNDKATLYTIKRIEK